MQVPDGPDQRAAARGHGPPRRAADLRPLLVPGHRRVGRDVVGEGELAVAVGVEAPLRVEDRVDLRPSGDVEPDRPERVDVGAGWARLGHPVDLPGDLHLAPALGGQVVDHVVEAPVLVAADLEAVALRQLPLGLLLAGAVADAGPEPHHVVQVQVPDARGGDRAVLMHLDHARLEPCDEALGARPGSERAGVARPADPLRVRAGLGQPVEVQVLPRVHRDRIRVAVVGRHVRVARGAENRLGGHGRSGENE